MPLRMMDPLKNKAIALSKKYGYREISNDEVDDRTGTAPQAKNGANWLKEKMDVGEMMGLDMPLMDVIIRMNFEKRMLYTWIKKDEDAPLCYDPEERKMQWVMATSVEDTFNAQFIENLLRNPGMHAYSEWKKNYRAIVAGQKRQFDPKAALNNGERACLPCSWSEDKNNNPDEGYITQLLNQVGALSCFADRA